MSDYLDCLNKGSIKNLENSKSWVTKELSIAEKFYKSTEFNANAEQWGGAIIAGYLVVFHLTRALVYNKGMVAKGHFCVIAAAKELYPDNKELLEFLSSAENALISRNQIQYDGYDANKEMADFMRSLAKDYLAVVKKVLKC